MIESPSDNNKPTTTTFIIILFIGACLLAGALLIGMVGFYTLRNARTAEEVPTITPTSLSDAPSPTFSPVTFTPTVAPTAEAMTNTPIPTIEEVLTQVLTPANTPLPAGPAGLNTVYPSELKDYLTNPGMGWQEAHEVNSPRIPESTPYRRWNWADFNPARGVYDWGKIEALCGSAAANGGQCHFGIVMGSRPYQGNVVIPQWVQDEGAKVELRNFDGEEGYDPDYANCVWLEAHDLFVNALREQYDGDPRIFAIDIRSYGRYGEWTGEGLENEAMLHDEEARVHIIDTWVGGSGSHACNNLDGSESTSSYSHPGFQYTPVLYTFSWHWDIEWVMARSNPILGIRHDCLGPAGHQGNVEKYIGSFTAHNATAPVAFEFCSYANSQEELNNAIDLCRRTMCSVVHDNFAGSGDTAAIRNMMFSVGYRYVLRSFSAPSQIGRGESMPLVMTWENVGTAPTYRNYGLLVALLDSNGAVVTSWEPQAYVRGWYPNSPVNIEETLTMPDSVPAGTYDLAVALTYPGTKTPALQVAVAGRDAAGYYHISTMEVK